MFKSGRGVNVWPAGNTSSRSTIIVLLIIGADGVDDDEGSRRYNTGTTHATIIIHLHIRVSSHHTIWFHPEDMDRDRAKPSRTVFCLGKGAIRRTICSQFSCTLSVLMKLGPFRFDSIQSQKQRAHLNNRTAEQDINAQAYSMSRAESSAATALPKKKNGQIASFHHAVSSCKQL